ncbi:DUF4215 domain-containing protein [Myxococcota bacterium]
MKRGNPLPLATLSIILAIALSCCDGGDSKCSATNPCVDGYICNKHGDCIEGTYLSIDTSELPDAYVGEPYEVSLQASGGIQPYQWSVQSDLSWLGVEEVGANVWALTGTPDASTLPDGVTVTLELTDDSLDGENLAPKDLKLIVHECVEGRKQNCYLPQVGICVSGDRNCTNNNWGSCDASTGPSTDVEHCGVDCTPCGVSADKCVGGLCACGNGSPCTGNLICCFGICIDDVECGTCGDGVKDEWEDCDKLDVGQASCLSLDYYGGQLHCLDDCAFDLTECEAAGWCGDIQINGQEDCDGTELGTSTCETFGYPPGDLTCTSDCEYDVTDCCGDGTFGPNEDCDDQNQDPWDGCNECTISEFKANTTTEKDQLSPEVAINSSGRFVVVWDNSDVVLQETDVYAQVFANTGGPIGSELRVNTSTQGANHGASVAMDELGNFIVVWYVDRQDANSLDIYGQLFDPSGGLVGGEFRVNTEVFSTQSSPSVAITPDGAIVVVWESTEQDGSWYGVYGQRYYSNGTPAGSEFQVNTHTDSAQKSPSIAMCETGSFIVVWESDGQDGSSYGVFGQIYDSSGNAVGSEFQVNTYTDEEQASPSVATDAGCNFIVAWDSHDVSGLHSGIYGQRFNSSGSTVGTEFQINENSECRTFSPRVAMDSDGNFSLSWICESLDDQTRGIYGRRYLADGSSIGHEFKINSYTPVLFGVPSLAMNSLGKSVVTWDCGAPEVMDVYAQRYNEQGEPRGILPW